MAPGQVRGKVPVARQRAQVVVRAWLVDGVELVRREYLRYLGEALFHELRVEPVPSRIATVVARREQNYI